MKPGTKTEFGTVRRVVAEASLLHESREQENYAWLVEMEDGACRVLSEEDWHPIEMSAIELRAKLIETEDSAASIRRLLEQLPPEPLPEGVIELPTAALAQEASERFLRQSKEPRPQVLVFPSRVVK